MIRKFIYVLLSTVLLVASTSCENNAPSTGQAASPEPSTELSATSAQSTEGTPEPIFENLQYLALGDNELSCTVADLLNNNALIELPDGTFIIERKWRIDASGATLNEYSERVIAVSGSTLIGAEAKDGTSEISLYGFEFDGSGKTKLFSFETTDRLYGDSFGDTIFGAAIYEDYLFMLVREGENRGVCVKTRNTSIITRKIITKPMNLSLSSPHRKPESSSPA
jgi:hypothetical protein